MELRFYLLLLLAYLLGAFSPSYFLGRLLRGIDLREHGSGNLGFTNALRVLGRNAAAAIFVIDALKGFVPAFFFPQLLAAESAAAAGGALNLRLLFGLAAICGHCLPFYLNFRGGKGVLTSFGAFLAVAPAPMLIAFALGVSMIFLTKYVSAGSLCGAAAYATAATILYWRRDALLFIICAWLTAALVFYLHRGNIRRLIGGSEPRYCDPPGANAKEPRNDARRF